MKKILFIFPLAAGLFFLIVADSALAVTPAPTVTNTNLRVDVGSQVQAINNVNLRLDRKQQALNKLDNLIKKMDKVEARVRDNRALSEVKKNQILTKLNNHRSSLKQYRSSIQRLSKLSDTKWNYYRQKAKKVWNKAANEVIKSIIEGRLSAQREKLNEARTLVDKLKIYVNLAKENDQDVSDLERNITKMELLLADAERELDKVDQAISHVSSNTAQNIARSYFRESNEALKAAAANLKEFRRTGQKVIDDLREITW